jgi:hypothetical protein
VLPYRCCCKQSQPRRAMLEGDCSCTGHADAATGGFDIADGTVTIFTKQRCKKARVHDMSSRTATREAATGGATGGCH